MGVKGFRAQPVPWVMRCMRLDSVPFKIAVELHALHHGGVLGANGKRTA